MKVERIKISKSYKKRKETATHLKTGKITIFTLDKPKLTIAQQDKLFIFLEKL